MRRWSARIMMAGYVALGWIPISALAADSRILVAGNQRVEADTIRSYSHAGTKSGLDAADLDAGLKDLYATELFSDARISHRDGQVLVTVVENPLIARVAFEGNSRLKTDDLKKIVGSKERGPLSRAQRIHADGGLVIVVLTPIDENLAGANRFLHIRDHQVAVFVFEQSR